MNYLFKIMASLWLLLIVPGLIYSDTRITAIKLILLQIGLGTIIFYFFGRGLFFRDTQHHWDPVGNIITNVFVIIVSFMSSASDIQNVSLGFALFNGFISGFNILIAICLASKIRTGYIDDSVIIGGFFSALIGFLFCFLGHLSPSLSRMGSIAYNEFQGFYLKLSKMGMDVRGSKSVLWIDDNRLRGIPAISIGMVGLPLLTALISMFTSGDYFEDVRWTAVVGCSIFFFFACAGMISNFIFFNIDTSYMIYLSSIIAIGFQSIWLVLAAFLVR
jgi:hypothetical protein